MPRGRNARGHRNLLRTCLLALCVLILACMGLLGWSRHGHYASGAVLRTPLTLIDVDAQFTISAAAGRLSMGHEESYEEAEQPIEQEITPWEAKDPLPLPFPVVWAAPLRTQSGEGMHTQKGQEAEG
jgi:hypothetical protein